MCLCADRAYAPDADVKFMGRQDRLVTASADKTARIWKADVNGTFSAAAVLKDHTAEASCPQLLFPCRETYSERIVRFIRRIGFVRCIGFIRCMGT